MNEALLRGPLYRFQGSSGGDIPDVGDVLFDGEQVAFVARGRVRSSRIPRPGRWIIMVTDRRLLCVRENGDAARRTISVALSRIEHAYQHGLLTSKVEVVTQRGRIRIRGLGRRTGAQLVGWVMAAARGEVEAAPARVVAKSSPTALPAAAAKRPPLADDPVLSRMDEMESLVEQLGDQVRFLENLLESKQRAEQHAAERNGVTT